MLVNNVGGFWNTRHRTADGLERSLRPFMSGPARGAATSIHVASAPELVSTTGRTSWAAG